MASKTNYNELLIVAIGIALLASGLAIVVGARMQVLTGGPSWLDTSSHYGDICETGSPGTGYTGREVEGWGQFPGPSDRGEVYASDKLWFAWFSTGDSKPVTVEARIHDCPGYTPIPLQPDNVYYRFSYSTDGSTWTGFTNAPGIPAGVVHYTINSASTGDIPLGAVQLELHGNNFYSCAFPPWDATEPSTPGERDRNLAAMSCVASTSSQSIVDGSALKVEVFVDRVGWPEWGDGPRLIASDEVQLRSAIPRVTWNAGGYKVGDTALLNWEIPDGADADGNAAYFLTVRDMNTNTPIAGYDTKPLKGTAGVPLTGQERIVIAASMFSNDLATCQNYLRAEIWSQLIVADRDDATVRSANVTIGGGAIPVVRDVSFNKARYLQGDTVTVTWSVVGNATKVHVIALIGGVELYNDDLPGTARSVSFPASTTGWLKVEVRAANLCSYSDFTKIFAPVGNPRGALCTEFPDAKECANVVDWVGLAKAGLAIAAILAIFYLSFTVLGAVPKLRDRPLLVLLLALAIALAAAAGFLSIGWFDVLLKGGGA